MKNINSYFRSFQVAVLIFILFVMVGCSSYPPVESHPPDSVSSGNTSHTTNNSQQQESDNESKEHFADEDQIEQIDQNGQEEQADEDENAASNSSEGEKQVKNIALTFDDGPDLKYTPQILDILQEKQVKATFFVVGMQVNKYPEVLKRIEDEGHLVGNHSYYHPNFTKLSSDELAEEINNTDDKIFEVLGHVPTMVRPPYGSLNDEVKQQLHDMDKEIVLWNIDPRDWDGSSVEDMFDNIMDNARDGGNILLHSFGSKHVANTVKLLPLIIDKLTEEGYSFVTVDQL